MGQRESNHLDINLIIAFSLAIQGNYVNVNSSFRPKLLLCPYLKSSFVAQVSDGQKPYDRENVATSEEATKVGKGGCHNLPISRIRGNSCGEPEKFR